MLDGDGVCDIDGVQLGDGVYEGDGVQLGEEDFDGDGVHEGEGVQDGDGVHLHVTKRLALTLSVINAAQPHGKGYLSLCRKARPCLWQSILRGGAGSLQNAGHAQASSDQVLTLMTLVEPGVIPGLGLEPQHADATHVGDGLPPLLPLARACALPFHSLFSLCHSWLASPAGEGVQLGLGLQAGLLLHDGEGLHEGEGEDHGDGGGDHADGDGDQEGEGLCCLSLLLSSLPPSPSPLSPSLSLPSLPSWRLCQQPGHRRRMPT